jgi:hypothetical protein
MMWEYLNQLLSKNPKKFFFACKEARPSDFISNWRTFEPIFAGNGSSCV